MCNLDLVRFGDVLTLKEKFKSTDTFFMHGIYVLVYLFHLQTKWGLLE